MQDKPKICFIMGTQRTGTNLLRDILCSNDSFAVAGEVVTPNGHPFCWYEFLQRKGIGVKGPDNWNEMNLVCDEWIRSLRDGMLGKWDNGSTKSAKSWVGGDIKYNQLRAISPLYWDLSEIPYIVRFIRLRQGKIIHVTRRNLLKLALSSIIAEQTGIYHSDQKATFTRKYAVDIDDCLVRMNTAKLEEETFRRIAETVQTVECVYEDLVANMPSAEKNSVATHLGGPLARISQEFRIEGGFAPSSNFKKVVSQPYGDVISNFEELLLAVSKQGFGDMAEEVFAEEPQNAGRQLTEGKGKTMGSKPPRWQALKRLLSKSDS
jgi:hypothetical protein